MKLFFSPADGFFLSEMDVGRFFCDTVGACSKVFVNFSVQLPTENFWMSAKNSRTKVSPWYLCFPGTAFVQKCPGRSWYFSRRTSFPNHCQNVLICEEDKEILVIVRTSSSKNSFSPVGIYTHVKKPDSVSDNTLGTNLQTVNLKVAEKILELITILERYYLTSKKDSYFKCHYLGYLTSNCISFNRPGFIKF